MLAPDASLVVFDNWRMLHSRTRFEDRGRHLTRYWVGWATETERTGRSRRRRTASRTSRAR